MVAVARGDSAPDDARGEASDFRIRSELAFVFRCVFSTEGLAGTIGVLLAISLWSSKFGRRPDAKFDSELAYMLAHLVMFLIIPVATARITLRMAPEDMGLGGGKPRVWIPYLLCFAAVVAPFIWYGTRRPEFLAYYPLWVTARQSPEDFMFHQGVMFFVMLANEFFFRGFMLFVLARRMSPTAAIVFQMIPYAMAHAAKPPLEYFASVFAGLALGCMAWRGRSIWPGVWLHWLCAMWIDASAAPDAATRVPRALLGLLGLG